MPHQEGKFTVLITRTDLGTEKIGTVRAVATQFGENIETVLINRIVKKIGSILDPSIFGCLYLISQENKIIIIPLVGRLVPGSNCIIIVVGFLVLEKTGGINKPVLEKEIPGGFDILGMQDLDHLFGTGGQQVIQFRIGPGSIEKPDPFQLPFINIKYMEPRIPACSHSRREQYTPCSSSGISQENMGSRNGITPCKIINGRVQQVLPGGIQVPVTDGN